MAFNYRPRSADAVRKRAEQRYSDTERYLSDEFTVFKTHEGTNHIRFLPPTWKDAEHYGLDIWVHSQVGLTYASVLCPVKNMQAKKCPICEAHSRALRAGDEELAKELGAKRRVLVWLLDCAEKNKGPQLWAMPWTLDRDINMKASDRQTGEIYQLDDPEKGYDVYFDRLGEKRNTSYPGATIDLARQPSAVNPKLLAYVEAHPLPSTLIWRDYEEIRALFDGGDDGAARREAPTTRREAPTSGRDARSAGPDTGADAPPADDEWQPPPERGAAPPRTGRGAPAAEPVQQRGRGERDDGAERGPATRGRATPPVEEELPWDEEDAAANPPPVTGGKRAEELSKRFQNRR